MWSATCGLVTPCALLALLPFPDAFGILVSKANYFGEARNMEDDDHDGSSRYSRDHWRRPDRNQLSRPEESRRFLSRHTRHKAPVRIPRSRLLRLRRGSSHALRAGENGVRPPRVDHLLSRRRHSRGIPHTDRERGKARARAARHRQNARSRTLDVIHPRQRRKSDRTDERSEKQLTQNQPPVRVS